SADSCRSAGLCFTIRSLSLSGPLSTDPTVGTISVNSFSHNYISFPSCPLTANEPYLPGHLHIQYQKRSHPTKQSYLQKPSTKQYRPASSSSGQLPAST